LNQGTDYSTLKFEIGLPAFGESKKWSLVNVQLSFVIDGGASRNHFLRMPRRRRIRKGQMTIEH
jgi:hypothetical protein